MPRQASRRVEIDIKNRTLSLLLTASDEHTIYLKGSWRALEPKKEQDLIDALLSGNKTGTFVRRKDDSIITFDNANVRLNGVDSMHGLALGGRGPAVLKIGKHLWTAI